MRVFVVHHPDEEPRELSLVEALSEIARERLAKITAVGVSRPLLDGVTCYPTGGHVDLSQLVGAPVFERRDTASAQPLTDEVIAESVRGRAPVRDAVGFDYLELGAVLKDAIAEGLLCGVQVYGPKEIVVWSGDIDGLQPQPLSIRHPCANAPMPLFHKCERPDQAALWLQERLVDHRRRHA